MAKDNDIMSEGYGEDLPEKPEATSAQKALTVVILACFAAIVVALTIKAVRWLLL